MQIACDPLLEGKRERSFAARLQVLQEILRKKKFCGVEEKTLLVDACFRGHRKQKLDQPVVEKNRADFDTVGHAGGIEIAQQPRLQVRMNVHEGEPLEEILAFDKF
jgi:hypothetical protein